ncbi:MAG: hypothetical protein ACR2IS_11480 [Nitrososphaeraceae archaeon]
MVEQQKKQEKDKELQYSFLKEICVSALCTDKKVSFSGVVDSNGKLLAGEFRESTSKKKGNTSPLYIKPTLFYSCFLTAGLEKWKTELRTTEADITSSSNNSDLHFKVLELDILKIAITPLTRRGEIYLCVYIEPSASSQEIISKICKAI